MKKILSIFITITILLSTLSLSSFALSNESEISTDSSQEQLIESTPSSFTDLQASLQENLQSTNSFISNPISITINETPDSFLEKITAPELSLSGSVIEASGNHSELSTLLNENALSRFEIVNIAYDQKLINESDKIETYCTLMENRQFDNMTCLHEPISILHNYRLNNPSNREICARISDLFEAPINRGFMENDNVESSSSINRSMPTPITFSAYTSAHFTVAYPSTSNIQNSEAIVVANYLESIRETYISEMGFRAPLLDDGVSTYAVYLFEESYGTVLGRTTFITPYGVACTTKMEIFNFSTLTTNIQETIAHEYFHAIQGAYIWSQTNVWFDEATANWGAITVNGTSSTFNEQIKGYLASTQPIHSSTAQGYGAVLYPLTLQSTCGIDAIKAIWEEYGEQTSCSLNFDQFKEDVVDTALSEWDESFDSIYLRMAYRNIAPPTWYASVHPGGASAVSSWEPRITKTTNTALSSLTNNNYTSACSGVSINSYSSNYYKFIPNDTSKNRTIKIKVTFSGTNVADGVCFAYYVTHEGRHNAISLIKTGENEYTFENPRYAGEIAWYGVIVCNVGNSAITYAMGYRVERNPSQTVELNNYHRYYEDIDTLGANEYQDYLVTFTAAGLKMIQTFGTKDTKIYLYDANGTLLKEDDDSGYSTNGMICYNFQSNTQYRIRVKFYSTTTSGKFKLSITATGSYANYEAIISRVDYTSGLSWSFVQNYAKVLTYKYSSTRDLTMILTSDIDVYLYIIDPRSTEPVQDANNTTPNLTKGSACLYNDDYNGITKSQITKTFEANVPYFIVASMYNPTAYDGHSFTISFG